MIDIQRNPLESVPHALLFGFVKPHILPEFTRKIIAGDDVEDGDDAERIARLRAARLRSAVRQRAHTSVRRDAIVEILQEHGKMAVSDIEQETGSKRGTLENDLRILRMENRITLERVLINSRWCVLYGVRDA